SIVASTLLTFITRGSVERMCASGIPAAMIFLTPVFGAESASESYHQSLIIFNFPSVQERNTIKRSTEYHYRHKLSGGKSSYPPSVHISPEKFKNKPETGITHPEQEKQYSGLEEIFLPQDREQNKESESFQRAVKLDGMNGQRQIIHRSDPSPFNMIDKRITAMRKS